MYFFSSGIKNHSLSGKIQFVKAALKNDCSVCTNPMTFKTELKGVSTSPFANRIVNTGLHHLSKELKKSDDSISGFQTSFEGKYFSRLILLLLYQNRTVAVRKRTIS
jgi:hypothetical protein